MIMIPACRFALNHPDLDRLREASAVVQEQLATYAAAYDIGDNLTAAADELRIELKPGAEALGVSLADVSRQVRQAYFGEEVQRLPRDGEDVRVMVRLPKSARTDLDSLDNLRIRTADGRELPLTQVAEFTYAPGINRILRRNRTRSVSVFAEVKGDGGRGQVMADMNLNFWPDFEKQFPDIERGAAGGFEEEQRFFRELNMLAIGAIVLHVYRAGDRVQILCSALIADDGHSVCAHGGDYGPLDHRHVEWPCSRSSGSRRQPGL